MAAHEKHGSRPLRFHRGFRVVTALTLSTGLASCGGGGGSAGAVAGLGATTGAITGFGSIFVNGVEVHLSTSTRVNDGLGGEDDLRLGQVVEVEARFSSDGRSAQATSVRFDALVEGPVSALGASGFDVLGQTVLVDAQTVFERVSLETLAVGNVVEVHGLRDADGAIRATRVEFQAPAFIPGAGRFLEVEGEIRALVGTTFRLGALLVDGSLARFDDLPVGGLRDGLVVEVKSDRALEERGGEAVLVATTIEGRERLFGGAPGGMLAGERLEVEGFVTTAPQPDGDGASSFAIGATIVRVTATTVFENGTLGDLVRNVKVEAEGHIDENGVLVAVKVSLRRASSVRIEALVDRVAGGVVTLLGLDVTAGAQTIVEDKSRAQRASFSIADVRAGDFLVVRGFQAAGARIVANRLEREDPDERSLLRGPASVDAAERLLVLGVEVLLSGATRFEDRGGQPIGRAAFLDAVENGNFAVTAKGAEMVDGRILAEEVELEDQVPEQE